MKWVVAATIFLFFLLLGLRLFRSLTRAQATIHIAHMKTEAEAQRVATVLRELRGVVQARIDLERHLANITYRKGKVTVEDMLRALHAAGF